jgi:integrative and conjugative element protein (TIGR02256 family)
MILKRPSARVPEPIALTNPQFEERIILSSAVLQRLHRHRQLHFWSREAGGQLFGMVSASTVEIVKCTGPYSGDRRTRYSYRSDVKQAQSVISREAKAGLYYVGEWHTHQEPSPTASSMDVDAFIKTNRLSSARFEPLILLIRGTQVDGGGSTVYSVHSGDLVRWD